MGGGIAILLAIIAIVIIGGIALAMWLARGRLSRAAEEGDLPNQGGGERPEHLAVGPEPPGRQREAERFEREREGAEADDAARR